jgi:hypothetical protein
MSKDLDDLQKNVERKTVFEYYDKSEFCTAKKVIFALREKLHTKVQFTFYSIIVMKEFSSILHSCSSISFHALLLLHTPVRKNKFAMPQKLPIYSCQTSRDMNPTTVILC